MIYVCCVLNIVRPGEKFKQKQRASRRGSTDTVDISTMESMPGDGDDTNRESGTSANTSSGVLNRFGAKACVAAKMDRKANVDGEVSTPLTLKTPRECAHLVK